MDSLLSGPNSLSLLGDGISNKTSRLYRALVERELAVGMSGGPQATIDPFLLSLTIIVHPKSTPETGDRSAGNRDSKTAGYPTRSK